MLARRTIVGVLAAGSAWGVVEGVLWFASTRLIGRTEPPTGGESLTVVVLGKGNRSARRANLVNRRRAAIGLRALAEPASRRRLVLSGGAVRGPRSEAAVLADHLRATGTDLAGVDVVLDEDARSTRENVENSLSHLEDADRIVFASDALHAYKARRFLADLRPDLARRTVRGRAWSVGDWGFLAPAVVAAGVAGLRRVPPRRAP